MSFDKEKVRRAAEKNLSQGKIQAAIRDYCQMVENDPKDYITLNTLGDLYVRLNAKDEAIICFNRIAEHYNSQGFAHKAIAMYKKILRLLPGSVEISAKLAPLYQMLGLVAEARTFYLVVAENHQKNGEQLEALEIWNRIADLDPNDTVVRLKLAENFIKENQRDKAAEAYTEAGNRMLAKKQTEEAAAAFAKALELNPISLIALSGATSASIALGFPDEAAERLTQVYELCPENNEILSLLAHAHVESENVEAAEEFVTKLVEREPLSYKRHLDVVRLYLKENNVIDAARVLGFCGEILISNNQEEELLHWINEILARDPEQLTALRLLTRVRAWQRNEDELRIALERVVESAELNNAQDDERAALVELATLFPEDDRYLYRLRDLGGDIETPVEHSDEKHSASEYVPTFESFYTLNGDEESATNYSDNFAGVGETTWETAATSYLANEFASAQEPESTENTFFEHVVEVQNEMSVEAIEYSSDESNAPEISADYNFESTGNEWNIISASANNGNYSDFARPEPKAQLRQELESVDFYISQNYYDLALEALNVLETQYGVQAEIEDCRARLAEIAPAATDNNFITPPVSDSPKTVEEKPAEAVVANSGFEDLFAEFGEDLEVAALPGTQTADYETHYNLGLAYKEMGLMDDAVEEFQNAVKIVAPGDGTPRYLQCCNLIGHCFMEKAMPKLAIIWYQRGLDTPGHTDDEYQALRYELGMAYERAGEEEKALDLFAGIYAVNVSYRNISDKMKALQTLQAA